MGVMQSLVNYPWALPLGAGLPLGVAVAVWLWRSWSWLKGRLFTRSGFFWSVICCFMAVSIYQGGMFFSISGDVAGFAVPFFLDLVVVVLMHAQLESRYRGEDSRANLFVFFIAVTCGVSTYANFAVALNGFDASKMLPHTNWLVQAAAPFVLASAPLFVIMMSIASEMIVNVRPLDKLKEEDFENEEKKRVSIFDIRNKYFMKQVDAEIEMRRIRQKQRANKLGLLRLPWLRPVDVDAAVQLVAKPLQDTIADLKAENERLAQRVNSSLPSLVTQVQALQQVEPVDAASIASAVASRLDAVYAPVLVALTEQVQSLQNGAVDGREEKQTDKLEVPSQEEDQEESSASGDELARDMQALLPNYPNLQQWLSGSRRSASKDEIIEVTGHTPKMIANKIEDHTIMRTRRPGVYRLDTVIRWLKVVPPPKVKASSNGHSKALEQSESIPV